MNHSFALLSFLISLGLTCKIGLTLTAGLGVTPGPGLENRVLVADTCEGVLNDGVNDAADEGVLLARMLVLNTGRGLVVVEDEDLPSRVLLPPCFLIVSESPAAKLSAVVCRDGDSPTRAGSGAVSELETESVLGDLDLCIGRGAGMGGLEAMGPVGRSITRSGVLLEVLLTLGVVLLCQPLDSGLSSPGLLILRRSQRSFRRRKLLPLELVVTLATVGVSEDGVGVSDDFLAPGPPGPHLLLPHDDCFNKTLLLLVSWCSDSFLAAGVTAVGVTAAAACLGLAPSSTLSAIRDCLCSGTGGEDDEDILLSGVSILTLDIFLCTDSV